MLDPQRVALEEKRAINIEARDAASGIKMSYVGKIPAGYQKQLIAKRARAAALAHSPAESNRLNVLDRRRNFNLASRRVFKLLDANSSLTVEPAELMEIASATDAEDFVSMLDYDGDGKIQQAEWLAFMVSVWESDEAVAHAFLLQFEYHIATKHEADATFELFDLNADGVLDWGEVQRFTNLPGQSSGANDFMSMVDLDRNGTVDRTEWVLFCLGILRTRGPEVAMSFLGFLRACFDSQGGASP